MTKTRTIEKMLSANGLDKTKLGDLATVAAARDSRQMLQALLQSEGLGERREVYFALGYFQARLDTNQD